MKAALIILRPLNIFLAICTLGISAWLLDQTPLSYTFWIAALVVTTFLGAGNILNDILDLATDKVSHPRRPLAAGHLSMRFAKGYMVVLFFTGIMLSLQLPPTARWLALAGVLPILILYTPLLKRIPLIGNLAVAGLLGSVFLFGEAALSGQIQRLWIPAALAAVLTLLRELVKDMADIAGDHLQKIRTFPVRFGFTRTVQLYTALALFTTAFAFYPFFIHQYGIWYLLPVIFGVAIPVIGSIFYLWKNPSSVVAGRVASWLKIATAAGLLAIFCSRF